MKRENSFDICYNCRVLNSRYSDLDMVNFNVNPLRIELVFKNDSKIKKFYCFKKLCPFLDEHIYLNNPLK